MAKRRKRASNGSKWRGLTARLRRNSEMCAAPVCYCPTGRRIDKTLHYLDPWAFTAGHIVSVAVWPEGEYVYDNLRAEHRKCNNKQQPRQQPKREPSIAW